MIQPCCDDDRCQFDALRRNVRGRRRMILRARAERAIAAGLTAHRPDVKRHLDAAVDQLLAAGHEVPTAEDIVARAADLATRPEREEPA